MFYPKNICFKPSFILTVKGWNKSREIFQPEKEHALSFTRHSFQALTPLTGLFRAG